MRFLLLLSFLTLLVATTGGQAATFAWNQTGGGTKSWIVTSNWTFAGTPNGVGDVANLNNNITGSQTVNLDQEITLGTLNIGDANGNRSFTLAVGSGGSLIMDVASGSASINKASGADANDTISAPVQFNDTLDITNDDTGRITFSGGLISNSSDISFNGIGDFRISTTGISTSGDLVKNGSGLLSLRTANTHTGLTALNNGTLELFDVNALQNSTLDTGSSSGSKSVTFAISGTNTYNLGGLAGADAVAIGGNTISVGANNQSTSYTGVLSGSGGRLTKVGTGTLALTGTNTYTGATTINNGVLSLSADANLGAVPGAVTTDMVVLNGGTLASTANFTLAANRGLTIDVGGGTLDTGASTTLTYNGVVAGSGTFNKNGNGTFSTGGAIFNTHTGDVIINAGFFEIAKTAYVGAIDNAAAVTVATGATLRFNGAAAYTQETIGSLSGDGTVDHIGLANLNFITGGDNMDTTFSGVLENTGTKVINLVKAGTGIFKLTGTNAYTGSTTVTAGTLQIDGVITSAVAVNSGATLSGTGSVSKAITIYGVGALMPGNKTPSGSGLGTFTLSGSGTDGDLTVASTGTLDLQLGANGIVFHNQATTYYASPGVLNAAYTNTPVTAGANDRIVIGGTLGLTGGSVIDVTLSGYTPALGDAFDLLDWATLSMGTFAVGPAIRTGADNASYDLNLPDITLVNSDYRWDTSLFASNGIIVVVPEPSRVFLLVAGLSACLLCRRRARFQVC